MHRITILDQAYKQLIEGRTPSEVRADLNITIYQWNKMLLTDRFSKLYEFEFKQPKDLIYDIECELWTAINELSHYKSVNWKGLHWKQRQDLNTRINNLQIRYSTFLIPK